jgi:prepilin-type N-terminal cleavage/methylation domain-containing protein
MRNPARKRRAAFSLLEVVLALALFGLAAVALMSALNEVSRHTLETVEESWITERLRSLLTEYSRSPELEPGQVEIDPGREGVGYRVTIERLEPRSATGAVLTDLLRVKVVALRGPEIVAEAETWRYLPLFQSP